MRKTGPPRRTISRRKSQRQLLVIAEGEKTEVGYLQFWHRLHRDNVNVQIPNIDRSDPFGLVTEAVRRKKEAEREETKGRGRGYDEVWCVFDVDQHPKIPDALEAARMSGIHIAISNPCIELWFVLHFGRQYAFIDRDDVQRKSKELLGCGKSLTDSALNLLQGRHEEAIGQAEALDDWHMQNDSKVWENPSTTIWRLVESIRSNQEAN